MTEDAKAEATKLMTEAAKLMTYGAQDGITIVTPSTAEAFVEGGGDLTAAIAWLESQQRVARVNVNAKEGFVISLARAVKASSAMMAVMSLQEVCSQLEKK
jgi:hypothetical protein